jgi:hypothetical protein
MISLIWPVAKSVPPWGNGRPYLYFYPQKAVCYTVFVERSFEGPAQRT